MKVYVMSRLHGEGLEALYAVEGLLNAAEFEVLHPEQVKEKDPVKSIKEREKLLKSSDFVVRIWTQDLPQDDKHALETLKPALKNKKPIVTLVFPPIEDESVPKALKENSKYLFFVEDFESDEEFIRALNMMRRDVGWYDPNTKE